MSMYLCLLLPLALGRSFSEDGKRRFPHIAYSSLICGLIFLTLSRSAWIVMCFVLLMFFIMVARKWIPLGIALLAVVVLFVVYPLPHVSMQEGRPQDAAAASQDGAPVPGQDPEAWAGNPEVESSTRARMEQFRRALPLVARKPLFGYGIGKTRAATGLFALDSYYLSLMLESGIPSLVLFLLMPGLVLVGLFRLRRDTGDEGLSILVSSLMISIVAFLLMLATISLTQLFFLWWILLAVSVRLTMAGTTQGCAS